MGWHRYVVAVFAGGLLLRMLRSFGRVAATVAVILPAAAVVGGCSTGAGRPAVSPTQAVVSSGLVKVSLLSTSAPDYAALTNRYAIAPSLGQLRAELRNESGGPLCNVATRPCWPDVANPKGFDYFVAVVLAPFPCSRVSRLSMSTSAHAVDLVSHATGFCKPGYGSAVVSSLDLLGIKVGGPVGTTANLVVEYQPAAPGVGPIRLVRRSLLVPVAAR
jgi:hypothetical protein